jgi:hypothetical protein
MTLNTRVNIHSLFLEGKVVHFEYWIVVSEHEHSFLFTDLLSSQFKVWLVLKF